MKLFMPVFSDITSWLARATVTATLWRSLIYLVVSVLPRIHFHSRKWKTKYSLQLYLGSKSGRNAKQKCLFLTMTERTTGGQSNFIGTRTEETIIVTKKNCQQMMMSVFASWTVTLPNLSKNVTGCVARNAILYHEMCVGTKGKRPFVYGRWHWSELYHQLIDILLIEVQFRSILRNFLVF